MLVKVLSHPFDLGYDEPDFIHLALLEPICLDHEVVRSTADIHE